MKKNRLQVCIAITVMCLIQLVSSAHAGYVNSPPLTDVVKTRYSPIQEGGAIELPVITWGGDIATLWANGNSEKTAAGSIFAKEGLKTFSKEFFDEMACAGR